MRKNLLEFLFGDAVIRESTQSLGEQVLKLFEEAADEETEEMVANKQPLVTALKSLGVTGSVEAGPESAHIITDDPAVYREWTNLLFDPENLHKLAEKGWVPAKCGDQAMTFEPAEMKIGFIELNVLPSMPHNDKVPDAEKLRKDAQAFASKEPPHDDMNPVEFDDKTSKDNQKGVGKAADGKDPEGTPKGSKKTSESKGKSAQQVADQLLEMTGTGAIPAQEAPMGNAINWSERVKKMRKRRGEQDADA
jgi:hypothetical protein